MNNNDGKILTLNVNGKEHQLRRGNEVLDVKDSDSLVDVLRDKLLLTGTKKCCDTGCCGSCTVLINNKAFPSCMLLAIDCQGMLIETIEGVEDSETGKLHPVQQAFIDVDAIQCGMCTPGIIMAAVGLLRETLSPSRAEISEALAGNICRCTGYEKYIDGIMLAAKRMRKEVRHGF